MSDSGSGHGQLRRDTSRVWSVLRRQSKYPDALQRWRQCNMREHDERHRKLRRVRRRMQHEPRDTVVRRFQVHHHGLRDGIRRLRRQRGERLRNRYEHERGKLRRLRAAVQHERRRRGVRRRQVHAARLQCTERQLRRQRGDRLRGRYGDRQEQLW